MKIKVFLFCLFLSCSLPKIQAGTGIQSDPFTVAQAIAKKDGSAQTYWVKGYVVGEMSDFSNNKYFYELAPPFDGTSAYLIADSPDEINLSKCMPVQLGTGRSDTMSLDENPKFWRKQVLLCGLLRDYFAMPGLKTLSGLDVLSPLPLTDESGKWNFFEDMDGTYTAASSSSIFAGGTYAGETGEWILYGATWGDSGNDQKWGKASARLRLSESSSGNPGYMQMNFDKANGVGVIRFWAGYYDTDNNGSLAIQISGNAGQSWETVVASQPIAKDWKEYQFTVNQTGQVRVRIMKAETGSAGINVDKIRISDFGSASGTQNPAVADFSYAYQSGKLHLQFYENVQDLRIYHLSGKELKRFSNVTGSLLIPLEPGIVLLKKDGVSYRINCW